MGTGLGHFIPFAAYMGFWVMCIVSLVKRPDLGLLYSLPFLPYRTMRDHFADLPLGSNAVTILLVCVLIGAVIKGKRPPPSMLYLTWFLFGLYTYLSMWMGTAMGNEPPPIWTSDLNFTMWKDYMLLPLLFMAASMVLEDRQQLRRAIVITAVSLFLVDRSALLESLSHSWAVFDESKRTAGPIEYGPNQLAAYLAQFAMFFWAFAQLLKRPRAKLILYGLVGFTLITTLYAFSRAAYIAVLASVAVLAIVKDRKLLIVLGVFLVTWQAVVPAAVSERMSMTHDQNGQLEASAQERVDLWTESRDMFLSSPIFGTGYNSFYFGAHAAALRDTHNYVVKVLVETGLIGFVFFAAILFQMAGSSWRLFRRATDPMYKALGLGFLLATVSCVVANLFGDRWTYVEINGLLWVMMGAVLRALQLSDDRAAARPVALGRRAFHVANAGLPAGAR